jgi:hypothetical protein
MKGAVTVGQEEASIREGFDFGEPEGLDRNRLQHVQR